MHGEERKRFLEKLASGEYTNEEYKAFVTWVENCTRREYEQLLIDWEAIADRYEIEEAINSSLIEKIEAGLDKMDAGEDTPVRPLYFEIKKPGPLWPRIAAAASILFILSVGGYFLFRNTKETVQLAKNDVQPGSNKAILISHGRQYTLSGAKNGLITRQAGASINKTADGVLAYANTATGNVNATVYDTLIVPRGGQHQLQLADGTDIWLNAESMIRYPENFNGKERLVELISGEAYVSVGHRSALPFRFLSKGQEIRDIGTEFDVNAYNDELRINTTLIKGAINVAIPGSPSPLERAGVRLKPGQQVDGSKIRDADIDQVIAWRQGMFRFDGTPLETIMRQVGRWYDVEVVYQDQALKNKQYFAVSTRFANVSQLLHDLELAGGVKFSINGRKITVLKNN